MATGSWPTIIDVASRIDGNGNIMPVAEMLSQHNDYASDMPIVEANEMAGHNFSFRSSIPAGTWRSYNQGTPYGKSTTAKARVGLGMLRGVSQVDMDLANHSGDAAKFRQSEDVAFLEGMSQTIAQTMFYGNSTANPEQFMGLSPFYNTLNTATAQNAAAVINGGGAASANTSMWLIGWGNNSIFGVYPRGSKAGLFMDDQGSVVPAYDSAGNPYRAWTTWFGQDIGLVPMDWRYAVRIANLDTTNAGLAGPTPPDLFALMANAIMLPPSTSQQLSGIVGTDAPWDDGAKKFVWYANRTILYWLTVQSIRGRNVLLDPDESAGRPWTTWRGIPIKCVDQLVNTEATVS